LGELTRPVEALVRDAAAWSERGSFPVLLDAVLARNPIRRWPGEHPLREANGSAFSRVPISASIIEARLGGPQGRARGRAGEGAEGPRRFG